MKIVAQAAKLSGHIQIPASKSHTIRSLILAAMANGTSCIKNPLKAQDTLSTVNAIKQLGAGFEEKDGNWYVTGWKNPADAKNKTIDVGNSGSLMYFLAPVLAAYGGKYTFTGDDSICKRPVDHLIKALEQMGIWTDGADTAPFTFGMEDDEKNATRFCSDNFVSASGATRFCSDNFVSASGATRFCSDNFVSALDATPFNSGKLVTDGALSQYVSGFMMAGSLLPGGLEIELSAPGETPYLNMTKWWLETVGVPCTISKDFKKIKVGSSVARAQNTFTQTETAFARGETSFACGETAFTRGETLSPVPIGLRPFTITIPSDWESAAFPVAAALVTGSFITIDNIDTSNTQGDAAIVPILTSLGADLQIDPTAKTLKVNACGTTFINPPLAGNITVSLAPIPDAICVLAALGAFIDGEIVFTDADGCRKKETDRVQVMSITLEKIGARVRQTVDGFAVSKGELRGAQIESYGDHRIAMALAVLGLGLKQGESVIINNAECCDVSFPHFFEVMNSLGANFEIID